MLRRILEPILLGSASNIMVNVLFNPHHFQLIDDEFIIAWVLSVPITELNRYIDRQLEIRINWISQPLKRFALHLLLISLCLLISLNVLGNAYLWITQKGFFSWAEAGIINFVTFCLCIILTFANWSIHFYFRWIRAETIVLELAPLAQNHNLKVEKPAQPIEIQQGNVRIKIAPQNIRIAKIEFGAVRVYTSDEGWGYFAGTLSQLKNLLLNDTFFQITRDAIVHRDLVKSISPSTFGKIQLTLKEINGKSSNYTVSRPKAAAFRKWYNSTS